MRDLRFVELLGKPLEVFRKSDLAGELGPAEAAPVGEFKYVRYPQVGVSIDLGAGSTVLAFFFAHAAISSEWATGVREGARRDELLEEWGSPSRSGSSQLIPILGLQGAWDRWDQLKYAMHVQYAPAYGTVAKVTVMHPSAVPR